MMLEVLVLVVLDTHMMHNGLFQMPGCLTAFSSFYGGKYCF